jgi:hypothetical protein
MRLRNTYPLFLQILAKLLPQDVKKLIALEHISGIFAHDCDEIMIRKIQKMYPPS